MQKKKITESWLLYFITNLKYIYALITKKEKKDMSQSKHEKCILREEVRTFSDQKLNWTSSTSDPGLCLS